MSPAPPSGSVKQRNISSVAEIRPVDQNLARNDDLIPSDSHNNPRKLEYEKSSTKSDSAASVENTTNAMNHATEVTSGSTMEAKSVTEVRIPGGRSIPDQVVSNSVNVSKIIPAVNTAPSTPSSEKEKNREPKPDENKTKTPNSEDKKDTNFSTEPTKTSTLPKFSNVNNVKPILGSNSYGSINLLPQFDLQPNPTYSNSFSLGSSHIDNSPPQLAVNTSLFGN